MTMVTRFTILICLLAAVIETILGCTSTAGLSPGDAIIVLFLIGPYLILGLFAWWQRDKATVSRVLFVLAYLLSAWGLYVSGVDSYRYHTEPQYRMVQRVWVFLVPMARWVVVFLFGLVLLGLRLGSRR